MWGTKEETERNSTLGPAGSHLLNVGVGSASGKSHKDVLSFAMSKGSCSPEPEGSGAEQKAPSGPEDKDSPQEPLI
jgi:hypothetical protein